MLKQLNDELSYSFTFKWHDRQTPKRRVLLGSRILNQADIKVIIGFFCFTFIAAEQFVPPNNAKAVV